MSTPAYDSPASNSGTEKRALLDLGVRAGVLLGRNKTVINQHTLETHGTRQIELYVSARGYELKWESDKVSVQGFVLGCNNAIIDDHICSDPSKVVERG